VANEQSKPLAAQALKPTAKHLLEHRVIDAIIAEPVGGAHRAPREAGNNLKAYLTRSLRETRGKTNEVLLAERYSKFRGLGVMG
jgi:acetyl-CoA carboxylase carboxyl transferase subunit alpha